MGERGLEHPPVFFQRVGLSPVLDKALNFADPQSVHHLCLAGVRAAEDDALGKKSVALNAAWAACGREFVMKFCSSPLGIGRASLLVYITHNA